MQKKIHLLFLIICISTCFLANEMMFANPNDNSSSLEENYAQIGYKSVGEALRDFKHHYKQDLQLPLRVPPVVFTHVFARFNDGDGTDIFEMEFINEQSSENNFIINVAVKDSFKILDKEVIKEFRLKGGNTAYLLSIRGTILLVFEKDDLQYRFSVDKRMSEKITPEVLVQIADSIDFESN